MGITSSTGTAEVRGEGRVNGEPGFTFRLIAVDGGKSDRLSLTISNGSTVYEVTNRPLTKGSIIVHKGK
jgi:hypothetical protein